MRFLDELNEINSEAARREREEQYHKLLKELAGGILDKMKDGLRYKVRIGDLAYDEAIGKGYAEETHKMSDMLIRPLYERIASRPKGIERYEQIDEIVCESFIDCFTRLCEEEGLVGTGTFEQEAHVSRVSRHTIWLTARAYLEVE